ncbi:MAG: hypothetical protein A3F83_03690 [Candidatus Glassbacteria bacterium RIFCSPLOWO2_12_FULL_58_11]|uniref:Heparinase II/III-like C-terminal domain-containing protein n=1 Tax=Candidatus Glassbacteria bacterium RIFCSPLOWO2_12_FULL_58_11 TaxID=1817867 RepID=A0A1F5YSV8_9BACT|nr:MAG: hypothetical protein A3F83_03690 [Candidatus Glassbacteria bacterium RIFCSPLOWO2_12_FULL_58_11]
MIAAASRDTKPSLGTLYPPEVLEKFLVPAAEWNPYAKIGERDFWEALPERTRQVQITEAEKFLGQPWPALPATLYLEFARIGNRSNFEEPYFERRERLTDLVLAECMENKGRFVDEIVNGLWAILEESSWVLPAHIGSQKAGVGLPDTGEPIVDLFSAETVGILSWSYYLLGERLDQVSPLIRPRLVKEAHTRVLDPCFQRDDFWWMAFHTDHINNWNPWCNSNWLTAALLLEKDDKLRTMVVAKILRSLDLFMASYHADGGCDEGPSYWGRAGASLFDCLELLRSASNGKIDIYDQTLIREMGRYIYRVHIDGPYYINFADAPAKLTISGDLVFRYGERIGDKNMTALGAFVEQQRMKSSPLPGRDLSRGLAALAGLGAITKTEGRESYIRDAWLDGIQVMAARSKEGSAEGLYLAAKGGHNNESHNHNDVGNFIVYYNGQPVLIDAGVGTYTRKTFSDQRYEIWTMQSAYHNLPTINGVMQHEGREFAARDVRYHADDSAAELSLDIAGTYPEKAGVRSWKRTVRLERGKAVQLTEDYSLSRREAELTLSLMTPCAVELKAGGRISLTGKSGSGEQYAVELKYDASKLAPKVEKIALDDNRLQASWGESLNRIVLSAVNQSALKDRWNLSLSGK